MLSAKFYLFQSTFDNDCKTFVNPWTNQIGLLYLFFVVLRLTNTNSPVKVLITFVKDCNNFINAINNLVYGMSRVCLQFTLEKSFYIAINSLEVIYPCFIPSQRLYNPLQTVCKSYASHCQTLFKNSFHNYLF